MGKKPVLGLIGLCVGLTLSGCKDCGCGWWSHKDAAPPVVNRVSKPSTEVRTVTQDGRVRTIPDRSTTVMGEGAGRMKSPYDHPANEYSAPAPVAGNPVDPTRTVGAPAPKFEEGIPTDAAGVPISADTGTPIPVVKEKIQMPPPPPPMSYGALPTNSFSAMPVEAQKVDPIAPVKEVAPMRTPATMERSAIEVAPAFKETQMSAPSMPMMGGKSIEPAAILVAPPAALPTPAPLPPPLPVMEAPAPKPAVNPIPSPIPELSGAPMPPPAPVVTAPLVAPGSPPPMVPPGSIDLPPPPPLPGK